MGKFLRIKELENPHTKKTLEVIDKRDAAAILIFNKAFDKIYLIKQFRSGSGEESWEIPAGVIDDGESPEKTAIREVLEETGLKCGQLFGLSKMYTCIGYSTEKMHLFMTKVDESEQVEKNLDAAEFISAEGWFTIPEALKILEDAKSITAINIYKNSTKTKIGIYGGTFNPVTNLHIRIAERAKEQIGLNFVLFEPVHNNYPKKDLVSSQHRNAMLHGAFNEMGDEHKMIVGSYEINEMIQPFTYQTMQHYQLKFGNAELYFICGSDVLATMESWGKASQFLEQFHVICLQRGGDNVYKNIILKSPKLTKYQNRIIIVYETAENNISSSSVRNLIKANMSINAMVPPFVSKYINEYKLYKDGLNHNVV